MNVFTQYPLLDQSECDEYIKYFDNKSDRVKILWHEQDQREHTLLVVNKKSHLYDKFCERITQKHTEISTQLGLEPSPQIKFYDIYISRYDPGEYIQWHFDRKIYRTWPDSNEPTNPRIYNVSVNLNSEYQGGDLAIRTRTPKKIYQIAKTAPGIATSFETKHAHRIESIKSGVRYSLIGWAYDDSDAEYYQGVSEKWLDK